MDVLARFADEGEIISESDYNKVETDMGNVYLPRRDVIYNETVTLGFSNFMWTPRITVEGMRIG